MRRELTDERRRLHKNTHLWARRRYRKIRQGSYSGHVDSGERARIIARSTPPALSLPLAS